MADEEPEPIDVLHPLLGVESPTATALLDHADPGAQRVLESTVRLYALRRQEQAELTATVAQHTEDHWPASGLRVIPQPAGLQESDLLQALLAEHPERMAAPLDTDLVRGEFDEAAALCRRQLNKAVETIDDSTLDEILERDGLDPRWARRWALADERDGYPRITLDRLIASLGAEGAEAMSVFSEMYSEGLITRRESALRYINYAGQAVSSQHFVPVPPAYLDRRGLLEALDEAFNRSGRVLIVGEPRSGRSTLLRTWWDAGDDESGRLLNPYFVASSTNLKVIDEPVRVGLTAPRVSEAQLEEFAMTGYIVDRYQLRDNRDQWLTMHAEFLAADSCEAIIVLDSDDVSRLCRLVPALYDFETVQVPTPTMQERAMIWMAHTMGDPRLNVAKLLAALRHLSTEEFATIDPWALHQCIASRFIQGYFDRDAALRSLRFRAADRLVERYASGEPLSGNWSGRRILRRLGGLPELQALLDLQLRLHGPPPPKD